jgi:hypothetical protein
VSSTAIVECHHHLVMCAPLEDAQTYSMLAFGRCKYCRRWWKAIYPMEVRAITGSTRPSRVVEVVPDAEGVFHEAQP